MSIPADTPGAGESGALATPHPVPTTDLDPAPSPYAVRLRADDPMAPPPVFGGGRPVILQVIPSLVTGGAERGCVDVAAAIQRAGGRAIVASAGGPMVRELERAGARHVTLPLASKNPMVIRRNADRLAKLIADERVDIVHARSRAPAWSAYWAAKRTGRPFVTTFHAPYNFASRLKRWYNGVMARGERVIAVSGFVAEHVASTYGVGPDRLRLIHRGIDVGMMAPDRVTQSRLVQLAQAWRIPEDRRVIMLPGRLTRWKGQSVLIDAVAKLGRPDVLALLVGADQGRAEYRRELETRIRTLGVEGQVAIVGHCNDMAAAYMMADVVVSASTEPEAFGRVIVEAQAMGRPVIVSAIGAVKETVRDGETGLVVPPGDAAALAAAIETTLALDGDQRAVVAEAAMDFVRTAFTKDRMCAETLAVYAELMPGG